MKRAPHGPREGSNTARLAAMRAGDIRWIETNPDRYAHDMRTISVPRTRRTGVPAGAEYATALYTAVGTGVGNIRYLIRLERTA